MCVPARVSLQCENDFLPRCANDARHRPYIRVTERLSLGRLGGTIRLCQDYQNGLSVNNTPVRILFASKIREKFFYFVKNEENKQSFHSRFGVLF